MGDGDKAGGKATSVVLDPEVGATVAVGEEGGGNCRSSSPA